MFKKERITGAFVIGLVGFYLLHIMVFDYYINDLAISVVIATANSIFIGLVIWVLSISDMLYYSEQVTTSEEK